jgi:hypothetical protein
MMVWMVGLFGMLQNVGLFSCVGQNGLLWQHHVAASRGSIIVVVLLFQNSFFSTGK